jgi:hypothetical protein
MARLSRVEFRQQLMDEHGLTEAEARRVEAMTPEQQVRLLGLERTGRVGLMTARPGAIRRSLAAIDAADAKRERRRQARLGGRSV